MFDRIKGIQYGFTEREKDGVTYFVAPALEALGVITHGFTSRIGGKSKPPFDALNLSSKRDPDKEAVKANFSIAARSIGVNEEKLVVCNYVHGNNVEVVNETHHGMGATRENKLSSCDGVLVTDKNTVGVTLHGDCTPIFLADKAGRAACVCHAGWRGTEGNIVKNAIAKFKELGIAAEDIYAAVGPTISGARYEVGKEVADLFDIYEGAVAKKDTRYYLSLPHVIIMQLIAQEIPTAQITWADMCTYENEGYFYSYRRDGEKCGAMGSFIALQEK